MPSDKKRINLTVSDYIYERLQAYKARNGLSSDATACLILIVCQLNTYESIKDMMEDMTASQMEAFFEMVHNAKVAFKKKQNTSNDTLLKPVRLPAERGERGHHGTEE